MSSGAVASAVHSSVRGSMSAGSRRASASARVGIDLSQQLEEIQQAYRLIQAAAAEEDATTPLQLSVHPGIPARRQPVPTSVQSTASRAAALSAAMSYDTRRRELSALTL